MSEDSKSKTKNDEKNKIDIAVTVLVEGGNITIDGRNWLFTGIDIEMKFSEFVKNHAKNTFPLVDIIEIEIIDPSKISGKGYKIKMEKGKLKEDNTFKTFEKFISPFSTFHKNVIRMAFYYSKKGMS